MVKDELNCTAKCQRPEEATHPLFIGKCGGEISNFNKNEYEWIKYLFHEPSTTKLFPEIHFLTIFVSQETQMSPISLPTSQVKVV